jgi:asparagine synthase (glutamine-hydrolysing)
MCGICGFVGIPDDGSLLAAMTACLVHRGPDSDGYFREGDAGLGMRRLKIIDLAGGDQPIANEDGSLLIVYNGEIYNYRELREGLLQRGHQLRTHSDTEVILHLFEEEGPACLHRLNGMFAIAIWNRDRRSLFLARDRLGIKPLYYVELGHRLLFASEVKALQRFDGFLPAVNPAAIDAYLSLRYVPGPGGMLSELRKLPAGHFLVAEAGTTRLESWWQPECYAGPFPGSDAEYLDGFAAQLERSVRMRLISEVPLGAYLSGGVDSQTITALMARELSEPVRTFTVGFDFRHDEPNEAAEAARLLGAVHTEVRCRAGDVALLPEIIYHLDEPLGDPIVIPMYQLAREAKRAVTVILAGEGADELLGGYLFHRALLTAEGLASVIPHGMRRYLLAPAVRALPARLLSLAFDYPATLGSRGKQKVADFLELLDPTELEPTWRHLISLFDRRDTTELYTADFQAALAASRPPIPPVKQFPDGTPYLNRILDLQFAHWLPDDILAKQDKLSMASGVEVRVPFLDHQLVEYALRLPPRLKIARRDNKIILRRAAARYLSPRAARRRKIPFYVPFERFMADPAFQEMLADCLSERAVRERGLFRPQAVAQLRARTHAGEFIFAKQLFSLVALELWFRMAVDRHGRA